MRDFGGGFGGEFGSEGEEVSVALSPSGISIATEKNVGNVHTTSIHMISTVELLVAGAILFLVVFCALRGRGRASED